MLMINALVSVRIDWAPSPTWGKCAAATGRLAATGIKKKPAALSSPSSTTEASALDLITDLSMRRRRWKLCLPSWSSYVAGGPHNFRSICQERWQRWLVTKNTYSATVQIQVLYCPWVFILRTTFDWKITLRTQPNHMNANSQKSTSWTLQHDGIHTDEPFDYVTTVHL